MREQDLSNIYLIQKKISTINIKSLLFDKSMGNVNKDFLQNRPVIIMLGQEELNTSRNYGWPILWDFAPEKGFILRIDCGKVVLQFINGHFPINCINSLVDKNFMWSIVAIDIEVM